MLIRPATLDDVAVIAQIYGAEVRSGFATFDTVAPEVGFWEGVVSHDREGHHVLVAEQQGVVVGYAKSGTFRPRPAYDRTVETSIYVTRPGIGLGSALYRELFAMLDPGPCHLAVAHIALPNDASMRLHEQHGFVQAGTLREVGHKLGAWRDVGSWQRPLGWML